MELTAALILGAAVVFVAVFGMEGVEELSFGEIRYEIVI
jgi:hypothetical protein